MSFNSFEMFPLIENNTATQYLEKHDWLIISGDASKLLGQNGVHKKLKSGWWNVSAKLQIALFDLGRNISQLPGTAVYSPAFLKRLIVLCQDSRKTPAEKCLQQKVCGLSEVIITSLIEKKKKIKFYYYLLLDTMPSFYKLNKEPFIISGKIIRSTSVLVNVNGLTKRFFFLTSLSHRQHCM